MTRDINVTGTGVLAIAGVIVLLVGINKLKNNVGKINPANPANIINQGFEGIVEAVTGSEDFSLGSFIFDGVQGIKRALGLPNESDLFEDQVIVGNDGRARELSDSPKKKNEVVVCIQEPRNPGFDICSDGTRIPN